MTPSNEPSTAKGTKLAQTIAPSDKDTFAEYASLNREGREKVRASAFERPDLQQAMEAERKLDALRELTKSQVALIGHLRKKEALLVLFSQFVGRACFEHHSADFPDVTAEVAIAAITKNVLELQLELTNAQH